MGGRERGKGGSLFLSGCIPDCAEDPGRLTKPDLAAAPGSSHAARQPTSGTQDSGGEQEHKKPTQRPAGKPDGRVGAVLPGSGRLEKQQPDGQMIFLILQFPFLTTPTPAGVTAEVKSWSV